MDNLTEGIQERVPWYILFTEYAVLISQAKRGEGYNEPLQKTF